MLELRCSIDDCVLPEWRGISVLGISFRTAGSEGLRSKNIPDDCVCGGGLLLGEMCWLPGTLLVP